jgi:hypothetical protein
MGTLTLKGGDRDAIDRRHRGCIEALREAVGLA